MHCTLSMYCLLCIKMVSYIAIQSRGPHHMQSLTVYMLATAFPGLAAGVTLQSNLCKGAARKANTLPLQMARDLRSSHLAPLQLKFIEQINESLKLASYMAKA